MRRCVCTLARPSRFRTWVPVRVRPLPPPPLPIPLLRGHPRSPRPGCPSRSPRPSAQWQLPPREKYLCNTLQPCLTNPLSCGIMPPGNQLGMSPPSTSIHFLTDHARPPDGVSVAAIGVICAICGSLPLSSVVRRCSVRAHPWFRRRSLDMCRRPTERKNAPHRLVPQCLVTSWLRFEIFTFRSTWYCTLRAA